MPGKNEPGGWQIAINTLQVKVSLAGDRVAMHATISPLRKSTTDQALEKLATRVQADVKGLPLNVSLAGNPVVTREHLLLRDWGRFQSPLGDWEECPYRRQLPPAFGAPGLGADAEPAWHKLFQDGQLPMAVAPLGRHQPWQHSLLGSSPRNAWQPTAAAGGDYVIDGAALSGEGGKHEGFGVAGGRGGLRSHGRGLAAAAAGASKGAPQGYEEGSKRQKPMLVGLIDQSIVNWCATSVPLTCSSGKHAFYWKMRKESLLLSEAFRTASGAGKDGGVRAAYTALLHVLWLF